MIVLFTDFGIGSPYVGQLHAVLHQHNATSPVIDLHADLAHFDIQSAAYLLPAYVKRFPPGSVFVCVVDPGVGSERDAIAVNCSERWFVGPDNGLFDVLPPHFDECEYHHIDWRPENLSNSFHGRDLFAPIAAQLSQGNFSGLGNAQIFSRQADTDLWKIIYVDQYGNLFSGIRANTLSHNAQLECNGHTFCHARTFSDVATGESFWYENSIGLAEIAVNQENAAQILQISAGDTIELSSKR